MAASLEHGETTMIPIHPFLKCDAPVARPDLLLHTRGEMRSEKSSRDGGYGGMIGYGCSGPFQGDSARASGTPESPLSVSLGCKARQWFLLSYAV